MLPELLALKPAFPEIVLAIGALLLLLLGAFAGNAARAINHLAVALILAAGLLLFFYPGADGASAGGYVLDPFARFMKGLTLAASAVTIALSIDYARREGIARFEYPILVVAATLGMMLMISASDLIALYLGLELQSLALYVVAALNRDSVRSAEAGLKYFVLGALSSGMLLYGASIVYGYAGTTSFAGIAAAFGGGTPSLALVFGLVFLLAGLAFKVAAVPFHMWTPDVYEGAPTSVTVFFAAAPKIAAMALLIRVAYGALAPAVADWQQIMVFLAAASMILGAFAAIGQTNIKRLMAYSSIGHVGYALVGISAGTEAGVRGVILYLVIYAVMTLGAFAVILAMRRKGVATEDIADLAGLSRTSPWLAFLFAMILFSLAGLPPLAGFFAKFYVFVAAVQSGLAWLAVVGVLASAVAAFYYLRIVKIMYFDEPVGGLDPMPGEVRAVILASGAFVMLFALFAGPVGTAAASAARSLF